MPVEIPWLSPTNFTRACTLGARSLRCNRLLPIGDSADAPLRPVLISHRQIDRHALALGEAVEHALERELVADASLLVAAVGQPGTCPPPWLPCTQPDSMPCSVLRPAPMSCVQT